MHAAKLHAALGAITEEFESLDIRAKLDGLLEALEASVQSSTEQNTKQFQKAYAEMEKTLQACPSNDSTPSRRRIFQSIGAAGYIGSGLWEQISRIITENSIALANALKQLKRLKKSVAEFADSIKTLQAKLEDLNIQAEQLEPGQAQIGISIPPSLVGSSLEGLGTEIHEFDDAFKSFQRIIGQESASLEVKSISPADFQLFLRVSPALAGCVATAVARIAELYNSVMQIKKLQQDLVNQSVPEDRVKAITEHEGQMVEQGLADLAQAILDEHSASAGKSRAADLKLALQNDLRFFAERIDRGVQMEVEMVANGSKGAQAKLAQTINQKGRALARLARASEPIFGLSEE